MDYTCIGNTPVHNFVPCIIAKWYTMHKNVILLLLSDREATYMPNEDRIAGVLKTVRGGKRL